MPNRSVQQYHQEQALAQANAPRQDLRRRAEMEETEVIANAQAGISLNIFAAFSGAFSGRKKKTTERRPDGSSHEVEESEGVGAARGHAVGNLRAMGSANTYERRSRRGLREHGEQEVQRPQHTGDELLEDEGRARTGKKQSGRRMIKNVDDDSSSDEDQEVMVDHLGIEGGKGRHVK